MQQLMLNKRKKNERNERTQEVSENIKRELCEAQILEMPTEKRMYDLDTYALVVTISVTLHQEKENSKVLSDTEMK